MPKKLVIIESPGKSGKFKKFLGSGYDVIASVGHCIDLPKKKFGINIKKDFEPTFEVLSDKKKILKEIERKAKKSDTVYLFTDLDREGSGIAWNIYNQIRDKTKAQILRATSVEITKNGIEKGIENAGNIDVPVVDAYLTRRILDRLVGFKTSFLTKQATGGRSAGRVQSAILRILVDREKEIINFLPEEYWVLTAIFLSSKKEEYKGILDEKIKVKNGKEAQKIYDKVLSGSPAVTSVQSKETLVRPSPPFATLPMCATSSSVLGWPESKTMAVAQYLYNSGFCTYHRSDSVSLSSEFLSSARTYIQSSYGSKYLPKTANVYRSKKGSQEAHEACRPTDVNLRSVAGDDNQKLYELIWRRTVSSQCVPGIDLKTKVITTVSDYDFITRGSMRIFDGFRKVWNYSRTEDIQLPVLVEGEQCTLKT